MLTIRHLVEAITEEKITGLGEVLSDAVVDSRQVAPGGLFVAMDGEAHDGHDYVADAFERGALAVLVERDVQLEASSLDLRKPLAKQLKQDLEPPIILRVANTLEALQTAAKKWRVQSEARVIGITGSVGKSTTKELVADVLSRRYKTVRSPGNLNNEIGLPLSILRLTEAHERAVLEMGFYVPGEIALLCDIAKPQIGVVTNISQVHLERAGSMDAIVLGKGELVEALPPEGVAILNYDDPLVRELAERTQARVFYYGLSPEADLWASDVEGLGLEGLLCVIHHGEDAIHCRVPLLGRHSVHTILRAASVGIVEGLSWSEIIGGLQNTHNQLRLVAGHTNSGALLLDDTYNAAPTSVIAALNLLDDLDGRKIAVLGDMLELGEFEERGHRMVGARAAQVVDLLITVGERAEWIAEEARAAGLSESQVVVLGSGDEVVEYLDENVGEGDVVLVKGSRGMRLDRIVTALEEIE
ncbi:MAG: UDP-N-acetylmuramoyl-tripeptide--D-alanyl-D-alanine ligase [Anaerolineales bacterium]|nr:UDP-N-acetylmuramoyl-tripeptide--D-alanyl-D-alanine ligase [Anaerolineales bacterium]